MKKLLICALFICVWGITYSQNPIVSLTVSGSCSSTPDRVGRSITLKFEVDKNKCDPLIGFISMEDKLYHFEESLKSKAINFSEFKRSFESKMTGSIQTEIYKYTGNDEDIEHVIDIAKNQEVEISKINDSYEKKNLEDQDVSANCALQDAIDRANYISKNLGYKHCKLISVDDDTSGVLSESLADLLAIMSTNDFLGGGGSTYSIVGHFEMY